MPAVGGVVSRILNLGAAKLQPLQAWKAMDSQDCSRPSTWGCFTSLMPTPRGEGWCCCITATHFQQLLTMHAPMFKEGGLDAKGGCRQGKGSCWQKRGSSCRPQKLGWRQRGPARPHNNSSFRTGNR